MLQRTIATGYVAIIAGGTPTGTDDDGTPATYQITSVRTHFNSKIMAACENIGNIHWNWEKCKTLKVQRK